MSVRRLALAGLLAAVALGGCGKGAPVEAARAETAPGERAHKEAAKEKPSEGVALTAEGRQTAGVRTEPVASHLLQAGLEVPGAVSIPNAARAVVTPPVAGKVVRLLADVGDRVEKGRPLAEIESGDLARASSDVASAESLAIEGAARVSQRRAAVELAQDRLATARENLLRQRRFAEVGAFSQPALTTARNELSEAQTEQAAAKSALVGAQSRRDRAERLSRDGLVSTADLDQARLDVRQAEIRQERASQRLALAEGTLRRESRIESQGLLNAQGVQGAEAETRAAKLELDQASLELQGAKATLLGAKRAVQNARAAAAAVRGGGAGAGGSVVLAAPIAGVVVGREATLGQAVERSSDLFDIEDASVVWVTASVPESEVSRVRQGASASVTTSAYPGRTFVGTVRLIGTRLDPKTRSLPVQCRIENPQRLLRAGLFAHVRLGTGGRASALALPESAFVGGGDERAVFVETGGRFERRTVRVGRTEGRLVEVVEGLKPGERVAVAGVFVLESESRKDELQGDED